MPSPHNLGGGNYWGTLIRPDKSPAPLLELLCLGIAQLMPTLDPTSGNPELTPEKLATFYRAVGGNYDTLFLHTKSHALSFIYQSLGCFHTLQPTTNAFEPPSIPALLPSGFVRWQTIQLLLCPDEHAQFLQKAVSQWDVPNPNGGFFPKVIPREAFPAIPDPEMVEWHENVTQQLEREYQKRKGSRHSTPNPATRDDPSRSEEPQTAEDDYFSQPHHHHHRMPFRRRSKTDAGAEQMRRSRLRRRNSAESPSPWSSSRFEPEFIYRSPAAMPEGAGVASSEPRTPSTPSSRSGHSSRSKRKGRSSASAHGEGGIFGVRTPAYVSDASSEASVRPGRRESVDEEPRHSRHHDPSPPKPVRARRHSHDAAYTRIRRKDTSPQRSTPGEDGCEREIYAASTKKDRDFDPPQRHKTSRLYSAGPSKAPRSGVKFREYIVHDPGSFMHVSHSGSPDAVHHYPRPTGEYCFPKQPFCLDASVFDEKRRASHGSSNGNRSSSGSSAHERSRSSPNASCGAKSQRWSSPAGSISGRRYVSASSAGDFDLCHGGRRV
ncbi:hypothetical protein VTN02DRAFT_6248 [Thermoascus thermophilus]